MSHCTEVEFLPLARFCMAMVSPESDQSCICDVKLQQAVGMDGTVLLYWLFEMMMALVNYTS